MKKKFKYPLSIHCRSEEQAEDLYNELLKLGYHSWSDTSAWLKDASYLLTGIGNDNGCLGFNQNHPIRGITKIDGENKELILALAAVVDDDKLHKGEYWSCIDTNVPQFTIGKLYKGLTDSLEDICVFEDNIGDSNGWAGSNYKHFRKATKKEIVAHFEPFVLPEKWAVRVTDESKEAIGKWRTSGPLVGGSDGYCLSDGGPYTSPRTQGYYVEKTYSLGEYKEITFEQFKKYVLKEQTMEKKIVAYKMKAEFSKFAKQAAQIEGYVEIGEAVRDTPIPVERTGAIKRLKDAGVLDVWFEPVYEEVLTYKVGDYLYCTEHYPMSSGQIAYSKGKVYLSEDDNCLTDDQGGKGHKMTVGIAKYFRKATPSEIEKATEVKIGAYKFETIAGGGKIGCKTFSKETALFFLNLLSDSQADAKLTIAGEKITPEIVKRIIDKL